MTGSVSNVLIAAQYVRAADPGKTVTFETAQLNWHSNGKEKALDGKGEVQTGGYNARYTGDKGALQSKKLKFLKKKDLMERPWCLERSLRVYYSLF